MSILRDTIDEFLTTLHEQDVEVETIIDSVNCVYGTDLPHPTAGAGNQHVLGQSPLFQPYVHPEENRR